MGKKNKKNKNHFSAWDNLRTPKKDKKNKKSDDGIKATLGKRDARPHRQCPTPPVQLPTSRRTAGGACNPAGDTLPAAAFGNMTPAYSAYTPLRDEACGRFGEDHIHSCKAFF